jgi:crotonobetainyl-CoA:carnitine CoA-transferase CaiB-like acyl-CoA transferase
MAEQALADLKVVEWGSFISAPYCTKLLADLGAEVIKVEPPGTGEETRRYGPFPDDVPDGEQSGLYLNTGKLSVTLDPATATGREIFLRLLAQADVLVENQPTGSLDRIGLGYDGLREGNPRLIVTSITPFGLTGPYAGWKGHDINTCALGGISSSMGYPDREPLRPPQDQSHYQSGLMAASATLIAAFGRDLTGEGSHVDLAEAETWATFHMGIGFQAFLEEGRTRQRTGHFAAHRPYIDGVLPCQDGDVCLDTPQSRQWRRMLGLMGDPEWGGDPIFQDRLETTDKHWGRADAYLGEWLKDHTKEEIFETFQRNKVPAAPIRTVAEVVADDQLAARGYFSEMALPSGRTVKVPGACYQFSRTPAQLRPAPRLGEHNVAILADRLGYSKSDLAAWRRCGVI